MAPNRPIIKRTDGPDVEGHAWRRRQDEEAQAPDPENDDPKVREEDPDQAGDGAQVEDHIKRFFR